MVFPPVQTPLPYGEFEESFQAVLDHADHSGNAATPQLTLPKRTRSMAENSMDFWMLAVDSGWNKSSFQKVFLHSLVT